jgi:hypothetical protein
MPWVARLSTTEFWLQQRGACGACASLLVGGRAFLTEHPATCEHLVSDHGATLAKREARGTGNL